MNLIVMNKSTLKRIDTWVSLADPQSSHRSLVGTFDDSAFGSELDGDTLSSDLSLERNQFEFYHPADTNSYSEWI